jgi:hypothetical protein
VKERDLEEERISVFAGKRWMLPNCKKSRSILYFSISAIGNTFFRERVISASSRGLSPAGQHRSPIRYAS